MKKLCESWNKHICIVFFYCKEATTYLYLCSNRSWILTSFCACFAVTVLVNFQRFPSTRHGWTCIAFPVRVGSRISTRSLLQWRNGWPQPLQLWWGNVTTTIYEFFCPPDISETIAVRIMKLAHCPRIASATIKLISKPILLESGHRVPQTLPT